MVRTIFALFRGAAVLVIFATASTLGITTASAVPAATSGGTPIPLKSIYRTCDFTPLRTQGGAYGVNATALAGIYAAAGTVTAEVHLSDPGSPGTHYDVRLIQLPRASESPCGPGDPGVAVGGLDTDGAGQATTTLQDRILPQATGVWVFITRPSQFSQDPAEFYTSEIVAPV